MASKRPTRFNPQSFLEKVGPGKTVLQACKHQLVFSQGDAADAVFYIQDGKIKLTVLSQQGKEAVVAMLEQGSFFGEGCLAGNRFAWPRRPPMKTPRSSGLTNRR